MINVLVVDDQNTIHKIIESYLEKEPDIEIIGFASNGQAAIEQVQKLRPDVVLMDIEMPIMNGFTATEIILDKFVATKILILTVHDNEHHLSKALQLGAKGYLLKNTTAQELASSIRHVHQGYFQLELRLIEKYLQRLVQSNSEAKENREIEQRFNFLYKSLVKLEQKIQDFRNVTQQETSEEVENVIKQKIAILKYDDSNLQFRVDSMGHRLNRVEQNLQSMLRLQLVSIFILIAIVSSSFLVNFVW